MGKADLPLLQLLDHCNSQKIFKHVLYKSMNKVLITLNPHVLYKKMQPSDKGTSIQF